MRALILLNPHAASGQALRRFRALEPHLADTLGDCRVAITRHTDEVAQQLHLAAAAGIDTVIAAGGDGTMLALLDALAAPAAPRVTVGVLPLGTGRDWARTLGMPLAPVVALRWLRDATPCPVDLGEVTVDGQRRLFLNVASAGLSGQVGQRVNQARRKRPWTFLAAIVQTLLQASPPPMRVWVDEECFYEGDAFLLSVCNGRFFGRGLPICPPACIDDGRFNVVLAEGMNKAAVFRLLLHLLRGTHLGQPRVHHRTAQHVRVEALSPPLGMDLDGEPSMAHSLHIRVLPRALPLLVKPHAAMLHP